MQLLLTFLLALGSPDGGTESYRPFEAARMTRPVALNPPDWSYPEWAREKELSGLIILRCVITVEGVVESCEVIKSVPGLTEWAIAKLTSTRYTPVTLDGRPTRVSYIFSINVRMSGRAPPRSGPLSWRPLLSPEMSAACTGPNARVCLDVALTFLHPDGGSAAADRGGRLLGAACEGGVKEACGILDRSFRPPRMIGDVPRPPFLVTTDVEGDVICLISSEGRAHDCRGPAGAVAEWFVARIGEAKFLPASFEKAPFETEYAIHFLLRKKR